MLCSHKVDITRRYHGIEVDVIQRPYTSLRRRGRHSDASYDRGEGRKEQNMILMTR